MPQKKNYENNTDDDDEDLNIITQYKEFNAADSLIIEKCVDTFFSEVCETPEAILKAIDFSSNDSCSDSGSDISSLPCNKRRKTVPSFVLTSDSNTEIDDSDSDV